MSYFTSCNEDTKQKLLNGTWSSYYDIDLKVDVASFSSFVLFAIITDIYEIQKHL